MPDLERLTDKLSLELPGQTPEMLAFRKGVIAGKNSARREFLVIYIITVIGYSIYFLMTH